MGHHGFFRDGDPLPEMRHGDQFAVFGPTTATFVLVPPGEHRLTQQQACGIPAGWKLREDAGDVGFAHVYQTRQPRLDVLLIRTIASVIPQLDSVQPVGNDRSDAQSPYSAVEEFSGGIRVSASHVIVGAVVVMLVEGDTSRA
eukprot:CAMPEP_0171309358 /NCGR_PEP_ID=MMETSP0816-20121228/19528_1 /TAXON_ID=420281 /ORGANISM="Proboscia inermis, Strain CCAP1064/1" /LENGTH=142 /DNA_ID=CAMNT_0011792847 /DNA_START=332 /DNA_END=761 /DNA_ORIENTATION=-